MSVFSGHGNSTTYRQPQNGAGAAGTARVVPKRLIHARGDMSEGKARRVKTT